MATRVGMVSLGCPKNQVDAEHMLYDLRKEGFQIVSDAALSDVVIINTCGFIESAKQEAIDTILEFCTLKQEGRIKAVIATGCLAERYRDEMKKEIPELDAVVGIGSNGKICDIIREILLDKQAVCSYGAKTELSMEGGRIISTEPFYAYIKIAEGCSNNCTYCAIPSIRGKYRSRRMEDIVKEARWLAENGVTELVVVAQDTTRYGEDIYGKSMLPELLTALCEIDGFKWIRTLYCYPERITDELLDVIAKEDKLVKYLDMPIQHASDNVLKRMGRRTNKKELIDITARLRCEIPDIALRTTLITGFPGETYEEHQEVMEFIDECEFDRLGVFTYSREEDTPAASMPDQIDEAVKEEYRDEIMQLQQEISADRSADMVGSILEVMIEGYIAEDNTYVGRSYKDAPNVDGLVFVECDRELMSGDFVNVLITGSTEYDLIGKIVEE